MVEPPNGRLLDPFIDMCHPCLSSFLTCPSIDLFSVSSVNFYAVAGNKAWQLRLTAGRPDYISIKNPRQIYEMETATVPIEYAVAFQQQVAAFGRTTVTWGVTLPAQTMAAIHRLIEGQKGGGLVIMPDGEVVLN